MSRRLFRKRLLLLGLLIALSAVVVSQYVPDRSLSELADWQNQASRFIDTDGMRVHYRREGNPAGPTLVLLHGTGASLHTWAGWIDVLGNEFDIVTMDLPGFGLTGPHPQDDYSIASYVGFVTSVVDALGVTRFSLAGNSLGGNIAWRFAAEHPARIDKLILIDPSGLPQLDDKPASLIFRLSRVPGLRNVLTWFAPESLYRGSLEEVYADDSKVTDELVRRYRELSLREGNRRAFVQRALQWERGDPEALRLIEAKTLIQWGEQDLWIPVTDAQRFEAYLADSETIVYPDLGHTPMEEDPVTTATDALTFLREASIDLP